MNKTQIRKKFKSELSTLLLGQKYTLSDHEIWVILDTSEAIQ